MDRSIGRSKKLQERGGMPPVSEDEEAVTEGGEGGLLSREDCLCSVCLEVFFEPVTLPCDHSFCKPCFLETMEKANLCCPLCRKRVSTWARLNSRTLVNDALWRRVQAAFPLQCQRRISREEDEEESSVTSGEEEQLSRRRQQEEEDKRLALRLQRQLDREDSTLRAAVDRRKGAKDQYPLRHNPARN